MYAKRVSLYSKFNATILGVALDQPEVEVFLVIGKNGMVELFKTRDYTITMQPISTIYNVKFTETIELLFGKLHIYVEEKPTTVQSVLFTAFYEEMLEEFKKQEL